MRKIVWKYKEAYLTEAEWRSLLHRFDPKRYEVGATVKTSCILCKKYDCQSCPVGRLEHCSHLIGEIVAPLSCPGLGRRIVYVRALKEIEAIAKIYQWLLALPRERRKRR